MTIRLHIERFVLEGLPIDARNGELLRAAVLASLERLIVEHGLPPDLGNRRDRAPALAPLLHLDAAAPATQLGAQIGAGIYDAVVGANPEPSPEPRNGQALAGHLGQ